MRRRIDYNNVHMAYRKILPLWFVHACLKSFRFLSLFRHRDDNAVFLAFQPSPFFLSFLSSLFWLLFPTIFLRFGPPVAILDWLAARLPTCHSFYPIRRVAGESLTVVNPFTEAPQHSLLRSNNTRDDHTKKRYQCDSPSLPFFSSTPNFVLEDTAVFLFSRQISDI